MEQKTPIDRITTAEANRIESRALPCPTCGYDLRGQGLQGKSLHEPDPRGNRRRERTPNEHGPRTQRLHVPADQAPSLPWQSVRGRGSPQSSLHEHDTHAQGVRSQCPGKPSPHAHDLQGQVDPRDPSDLRCPECGQRFDDFEAMRMASAYAARVSTRIIQVRARVAAVLGLGFIAAPVFAGLGYLIAVLIGTDRHMAATGLGFAVAAVLFGIGGARAAWVFLQVLWCCAKPRVPMEQKCELLGSIPILLVFQILFPVALMLLFSLIAMCF